MWDSLTQRASLAGGFRPGDNHSKAVVGATRIPMLASNLRPALVVIAAALSTMGCAPGGSERLGRSEQALTPVVYAPRSTLLAPGTTTVAFTMTTDVGTDCGWSLGADAPLANMTAFQTGQGAADHATTFTGLGSDPLTVNAVYVRCASDPDPLVLSYRALGQVSPSFPRKGNLWGWWEVMQNGGVAHAARIDLFLGAGATGDEIAALRAANPNVLVLTSINTVEEPGPAESGLPADWYLNDTNGNPIEVWTGAYRVNVTKPEVAAFKAEEAYQTIADTGFMADGCFFDNFYLAPSWLDHDMWGNPVQPDVNGDGQPDDPATMDAAWRAGVLSELTAFRALMPDAYVDGHAIPADAESMAIFNGDSIGFALADVLEGEATFPAVRARYDRWWELGHPPAITMFESSPLDDIAYGYGYSPLDDMPASTLAFARDYYPFVRFGLATTLLNDGYFAHEIGDTYHGNDWWYDELDQDLGMPCGPAANALAASTPSSEHVTGGDFEADPIVAFTLSADGSTGAAATLTRDTTTAHGGQASARIDISNAGDGTSWKVSLHQHDISVAAAQAYDLVFSAKADAAHSLEVSLQKQVDDWRSYGLWGRFTLGTDWQTFTVPFEATETAADGSLGFFVGQSTGTVWIDDVSIRERPPEVWRREFTHGMSLLNATHDWQSVDVGAGFSRFTGAQAAAREFLVDDGDTAFSTTGSWTETAYDSGEWVAVGPYYHDFGPTLHESDDPAATASFALDVRRDDSYTILVWWPAGPRAPTFAVQASYEIVNDGAVVASATLDQTAAGDEWHAVGQAALTAAGSPLLRVSNAGAGTLIADAVHVYGAARYNDGSDASAVELAPQDGILLLRTSGAECVPVGGSGGAGGAGGGSGATGTGAGAASDAGSSDDEGGCGCRTTRTGHESWPLVVAGLATAVALGRRRRSRPAA